MDTNIELENLSKIIIDSYKTKKLLKGYYQTIRAIKYYNCNKIKAIYLATDLDKEYLTVLNKLIEKCNLKDKINFIKLEKQERLVYDTIKDLRVKSAPFKCRIFTILE